MGKTIRKVPTKVRNFEALGLIDKKGGPMKDRREKRAAQKERKLRSAEW